MSTCAAVGRWLRCDACQTAARDRSSQSPTTISRVVSLLWFSRMWRSGRHLPDADVYFLANTANVARDVNIGFRSQTPYAEVWDLFTGRSERLDRTSLEIALHFEPYASRLVVFRATPGSAPAVKKRSAIA